MREKHNQHREKILKLEEELEIERENGIQLDKITS